MKKLLHSAYVVIASFFVTGLYCVWIIFWQLIRKQPQAWANRIIRSWAARMLSFAQVDYQIINPDKVEPVANQPTIMMCNHSSVYDIPLSFMLFPDVSIRMLAKKELTRIPLFSTAMKRLDFIFVDRKKRTQAIKDLDAMKDLMKSGIVMWVAPEGTRSRSGKLMKFKKGGFITAINTKATIIPIGIRDASNILPPDSFLLNPHPKAEIHIGQPVDASQYSMDTKEELVELIREQIAQLSGAERIEHTTPPQKYPRNDHPQAKRSDC